GVRPSNGPASHRRAEEKLSRDDARKPHAGDRAFAREVRVHAEVRAAVRGHEEVAVDLALLTARLDGHPVVAERAVGGDLDDSVRRSPLGQLQSSLPDLLAVAVGPDEGRIGALWVELGSV